jgi:hypothetical protein
VPARLYRVKDDGNLAGSIARTQSSSIALLSGGSIRSGATDTHGYEQGAIRRDARQVDDEAKAAKGRRND